MESIREQFEKLTGARAPNRDSADILRSRVTLSYGLRATGLSPTAFGKKYVDRDLDDGSALVRKWATDITAAGRRSIARLEPAVPGILALYSHPVFDLLCDRQIGRRRIASLLSRYRNPTGQFPPGWFGDECERYPELRFIPIVLRDDTSALWQRGDMDGFTVILGLVREAEAIGDTDAHINRVADLYRAFPAVARIPWFRPHLLLLRWCVERIHLRNLISLFSWQVNWSVIYSKIRTPTFETARLRWSRDPQTGRFIEPRHPCSPANKCPPRMVRNPLRAVDGKALSAGKSIPGPKRGRPISHWLGCSHRNRSPNTQRSCRSGWWREPRSKLRQFSALPGGLSLIFPELRGIGFRFSRDAS